MIYTYKIILGCMVFLSMKSSSSKNYSNGTIQPIFIQRNERHKRMVEVADVARR